MGVTLGTQSITPRAPPSALPQEPQTHVEQQGRIRLVTQGVPQQATSKATSWLSTQVPSRGDIGQGGLQGAAELTPVSQDP